MDILASFLPSHGANGTASFADLATPHTNLPYGADLYSGTDLSSLNFFEKAWMDWYIWIGNPVIATGLMSFLLHGECQARWRRRPHSPQPSTAMLTSAPSPFPSCQKPSTLDAPSLGSSSTRCPPCASTSCRKTRRPRPHSSGSAPNTSCSPTLPWSCHR